jgi:hypothetical protein
MEVRVGVILTEDEKQKQIKSWMNEVIGVGKWTSYAIYAPCKPVLLFFVVDSPPDWFETMFKLKWGGKMEEYQVNVKREPKIFKEIQEWWDKHMVNTNTIEYFDDPCFKKRYTFFFKDKIDAMMFKLKWS